MFQTMLLLAVGLAHAHLAPSSVSDPDTIDSTSVQCPLTDVAFLRSATEADFVDCLAELRWNHRGISLLHVAAAGGSPDAIEVLLRDGADANAKTERGRGPLHYAVAAGHAEAVQVLLDAGANPNAPANDGRTPLHYAAEAGETESLQALLDAGANPNATTNHGQTPLHVVAEGFGVGEAVQKVQVLLDAGADPNAADIDGWTPLHYELTGVGPVVPKVQALLDAGANPSALYLGRTPVQSAADGNADAMRGFLHAGADPNATYNDGWTLLHYAAFTLYDGPETVQTLLDAGADPNATNNDGATPLDIATAEGNAEAARVLRNAAGSPPTMNGSSG